MTLDMTKTTEPKSDQMNYDDFIGGQNKTIMIADVRSTGNSDAQPISIHYEGDNGKPWKPCKSMRRVLVHGWGGDGLKYIGKSLTLFGDPEVKWAGKNVGGIRISHMSHIENEMNISLTSSQGKRKLHQVKPLKVDMGNIDEEVESVSAEEIYKEALFHAEKGMDEYQKHFTSLNKNNKKRLNDSGDHEKLKTIAKSQDDEIPADPSTSQDQEAGNVESDVTAPQTNGSTTPDLVEPITDENKWLACDELISTIDILTSSDLLSDFMAKYKLNISEMSTSDQKVVFAARDKKRKELSNAQS